MDYFVTYLVVTCDDKSSIREDQRVMSQKDLHANVEFWGRVGGVGGVNVVMITFKIAKLCCV